MFSNNILFFNFCDTIEVASKTPHPINFLLEFIFRRIDFNISQKKIYLDFFFTFSTVVELHMVPRAFAKRSLHFWNTLTVLKKFKKDCH